MDNHGPVRSSHCDKWKVGWDCGFDEKSFYIIAAILWLVTSLAIASKAFLTFGKKCPPTGAAKWCLVATAVSSAFMSLDAFLYVLTGPHGYYGSDRVGGFDQLIRIHFCIAIGTIFLGFGLRWFGWLWCTISGALEQDQTTRTQTTRSIIKVIFDSVALVNVPFAVCMGIGGTSAAKIIGVDYDIGNLLWMGWCFVAVGCGFTLNSTLMWALVRNRLSKEAMVGKFVLITKLNLAEQLLFNLCLAIAGVLYHMQIYQQYGAVQATVYWLALLTAWMMHVQVLIFFVVATPDDPLYSEKRLQDLLLLSSGAMAEDGTEAKPPYSLKPSVIGSPDLESVQARPTSPRGGGPQEEAHEQSLRSAANADNAANAGLPITNTVTPATTMTTVTSTIQTV